MKREKQDIVYKVLSREAFDRVTVFARRLEAPWFSTYKEYMDYEFRLEGKRQEYRDKIQRLEYRNI